MKNSLLANFDGPIVMIGFGSIGKGTLPLLERHIAFDRSKFVVIAPDDRNCQLLEERQIKFLRQAITRDNYRAVLSPLLTEGPGRGMVVNLSVDTSSVDLMELAKDLNAFYIDTVVEPWPGLYTDQGRSISERSNYALREGVLELRRRRPGGVTAVSCCGANPGMVSWMVKQALIDVASDLKLDFIEPQSREQWARLMRRAGVKGIHIDLPDASRRGHPRPLVDADCAGSARLDDHAQRVDFNSRLLHSVRGWQSRLSANLPLCLSPMRRCRAVAARNGGCRVAAAAGLAHPQRRRHRRWH